MSCEINWQMQVSNFEIPCQTLTEINFGLVVLVVVAATMKVSIVGIYVVVVVVVVVVLVSSTLSSTMSLFCLLLSMSQDCD